jgi:uncharacterized MAPEG superfamily protein
MMMCPALEVQQPTYAQFETYGFRPRAADKVDNFLNVLRPSIVLVLAAEVVEKLDDTICWSGVAFEVSARMLGSDRRH